MATNVTTDDILLALREAMNSAGGEEGSTAEEIAAAAGRSRNAILKWLKVISKQGRLEVVQVQRQNIAGIVAPVIGYRIRS
jgi:predicted transcriptional regulator